MIAYAETNFVLELARLQEQHQSCEEFLHLAKAAKIRSILPSFSIIEARTALIRLAKQRVEFQNKQLIPHLHELSRSKPYKEISEKTEPLTKALIESSQEEWNALESVTSLLLTTSDVIPLTTHIVQAAIRNEQALGLEPADAAVYSSIIVNIRGRESGPKRFVNKNSKDFANPDIYDELSQYDCVLIPSFDNALKYVFKRLSEDIATLPDEQ